MTTIFEVGTLGVLSVEGPDAEKFLQGQLTCDMKAVTPEYLTRGAHCNTQGRMVSLFDIVRSQQGFRLVMPKDILELAKAHLEKYALFSKVTIGILPVKAFGIIGEHLVKNALSLGNNEERYLVIDTLAQEHPTSYPLNDNAWWEAEISANRPFLSKTTSSEFLPQELGLKANLGLSFNKGCYLGQEIVARLHFKGQLKTTLYKISFPHAMTPGEKLYQNEQVMGRLICSAYSSALQTYIGFALVQNATLQSEAASKISPELAPHFHDGSAARMIAKLFEREGF